MVPLEMQDYLSDVFLNRVKRGYGAALARSNDHHGRMWSEIDQGRAPIHAALMSDTNDSLRQIFANPAATELFNGIDYLRSNVLDSSHAPDTVIAGSAVGSHSITEHLNLVAKRLFPELPAPMQEAPFPNPFPGEVGLQTPTGCASYRAIQTAYQAWLIQRALDGCKNRSVLEIGPGMGRTAYHARYLGITDYTTIDLPLGIIAQACFLGATLGPDSISLPGESPVAGRIKLMVAGEKPDKMFGIVFNADSMTEMSLAAALDYLSWIHSHCERFVSVNKNNNLFIVSDIARKWFTLADRQPHVVAPGYLEETFVPRQRAGLMAWHMVGLHLTRLLIERGPRRAVNSLIRRAHKT